MGCCGSSNSTPSTLNNDFMVHDLPDINKEPTHIILMGDSVLDDFYWLKDNTLDVEQQCWNTFGDKIRITNLAVDESQTHHVLHGIRPNPMYSRAREQYNMSPYPITYNADDQKALGGAVYPLQSIKQSIEQKDIDMHNIDSSTQIKPTIVLSVGGNDGRVHLHKLSSVTGGAKDVIKALKDANFVENYKQIVDTLVNEFKMNVILVFVYQIQSVHMIYKYKSKVKELIKAMAFAFKEICEVAQKYQLPIIDLSRTFVPTNSKHYGSTPIEPSNISGQFIVDLVEFVLRKYDFEDGNRESLIFYGIKNENSFTIEVNTKSYREKNMYLSLIQHRNQELDLI